MPKRKTESQKANKKTETFKVSGEKLIEKIKELIKEGNVRRVIIKDKNDKELFQFPLTFGVIGAALAPVLAAVGAIAALVTECSITVERE
jgi:hypothetical protein